MLALHAIWSGSSLQLWAEDDDLLPRQRRTARVESRRRGVPSGHPFAADVRHLRDALGSAGASAAGAEVMLLLPTTSGRPRPSPTIWWSRGSRRPSRATPRLVPWRVPSLELEPDHAIDALLSLSGGSDPAAGLAVGASVRAFARAVELALDLTARGRLLPGIARDGEGRPVARWLPVPDQEDAERIVGLARSMPPLCRAEWCDGSRDGRDPGEILAELIGAVVDHVARTGVRGRELLPPSRSRRRSPSSSSEAFVAALAADDPVFEASEVEITQLERMLSEWHTSGMQQAGPVRTTFRLVPPADGSGVDIGNDIGQDAVSNHGHERVDEDPWLIEFLLQSREDPSLLVPAQRVWRSRGRIPVLSGLLEHPRERLLTDLGHASRLFPEIERALDMAQPTGVETDTAGAYSFLAEAAPLLQQAGFGVLVPPWWRSRATRLGLRVHARPTPPSGVVSKEQSGLDGIFDYSYQVALGEDVLSEPELRRLAELKVPLVRVRGQWVELRSDEIEAALQSLEQGSNGAQATAGELLRQGLGLAPPTADLPVVSISADGWLGELLAADGRLEPLSAPAGFEGSLRPYQERGLSWLAFMERTGLGACLADDMGLGKTIQLLALLLAEREGKRRGRSRPRPTLLICPMSLVGNWQREAERFAAGLDVQVHHGGERLTGRKFAAMARSTDLVITTFGLAVRDAELLGAVRWGRIVVDEAQNIKNAEAKQSRAVRALQAPSRIALTGTPVENRLAELWSIMEFCNPGLLGSARGFRDRFAVPIERYGDDDAAQRLKRIVGPFLLRRLKTDRSIIADLPDKIEMKVYCNLTREQAALYQAVVDDMLERIESSEGIERRGLVLATMMKLKQVCNHPAHLLADGSRLDGRSGKLARLDETLEEALAEGDRALCFTQFAEMGQLLRGHLQRRLGVEIPFLHGGASKKAREEMVTRFHADDGPPVLLLSLKAGGVGLNLTAANHVIHFDRWWNPAVEDQATDRAFRIGQERNVQVRKLVCVGTLEERIDRMIEDKRQLAERIVGTGEGWLTELSTSQLRDLVALSADAVAEA